MIKAHILRAVPAAGKTKAILEHVKDGGKAVIASISRQLNKQSYDYYNKIGGTGAVIVDGDHLGGFAGVLKAVEHHAKNETRVIFITHHALLQLESVSLFKGYDLYIDEVPDIVSLESFKIRTNLKIIEDYCNIEGDGKLKSLSIKRGKRGEIKQQITDAREEYDCISVLLYPLFLSLLQGHPVRIKEEDDGHIIFFVRDETRKDWELFSSITIACANFENTFTGHILKHWQGWEFYESPLNSKLDFLEYPNSSRVTINVMCDRDWSRSVSEQELDGETVYAKIKDKIDTEFSRKSFIYTVNKSRSRLSGKVVMYNPHGLNKYINETNIVALFSYNPQPWQIPILQDLAELKGLNKRALIDAFIVSKYLEPIFQLCTRGDIRRITSTRKINLFVPDMRAAEYLKKRYLKDATINTDAIVEIPKKARKKRVTASIPAMLGMSDKERQKFYYWQRTLGQKLDMSNPTDIIKARKWLNEKVRKSKR